MKMSTPAPVPDIGPDPDDYCHDCETADALGMEGWCDDPRCRQRRCLDAAATAADAGPAGGREASGVLADRASA